MLPVFSAFGRRLVALVGTALALGLAACGSGDEGAAGPATTSPPAAPAAFPVTIDAANGELTLEHRPTRIISLSPTATESLFAIGAGAQVAAVDDQSNYPSEAPRTKLSGYTPNAEAIAGYEPDLVVAAFDPGGLVGSLERLEIPVLLQPAAQDLDDAYEQIEQLGAATGRGRAAADLVASLRSRIAGLVEKARGSEGGVSVYHELGPDYYSATSKTFIGSIYRLLGLRNIADGAGGEAPDYPQLSAEYILAEDPDLIVLADTKCCGQTPETVAARPGWKGIGAVENGAVVPVRDDVASRWGPRILDFVRLVGRKVAELRASR
ncbi:MAG: ABC transporter substrate-binding protein [Gaiellaceae bacterium]